MFLGLLIANPTNQSPCFMKKGSAQLILVSNPSTTK